MHARAPAGLVARLAEFVRQRFPPAAYVPLILVFTAAGLVPAARHAPGGFDLGRYALAALAVAAAFLHLRLADELKDYEIDRLGRPQRPLPSGLVTVGEVKVAAVAVIGLGIAAAVPLGPVPLVAYGAAVAFIVLADFDFGAPARVHRNLLIYALLHSPSIPLLLAFSWLAAGAPLRTELVWLLLVAWPLGLALELARKSRPADEERPFVETYSAYLGHRRASLLAGLLIVASIVALAGYASSAGFAAGAAIAVLAALAAAAAAFVLAGRVGQRALEATADIGGLLILASPTVAAILGAPAP